MFAPAQFLSLEHTAHPKLFEDQNYVWNALKQISSYLQFRLKPAVLGELVGRPFIGSNVFVGRGAIVGDRTEIGCNAVLNPGSVMGRDCLVYPNVNFRGVLPEGSVVKIRQELQILERRDRNK